MALVIQSERLRDQLQSLRALVALFEAGRLDFVGAALDWLTQVERLLRELRSSDASEVVSLRASVLAATARRGDGPAGGRRRAEALSALDALRRVEELLRTRLVGNETRVDTFEDKLIEAVSALAILGELPNGDGQSPEDWARSVWQALSSHQTTRPTSVWLAASMGAADRLVLLDRILMRLADADLPVLQAEAEGN